MEMYTERRITLQKVEKQRTPNVGENVLRPVSVSKHIKGQSRCFLA